MLRRPSRQAMLVASIIAIAIIGQGPLTRCMTAVSLPAQRVIVEHLIRPALHLQSLSLQEVDRSDRRTNALVAIARAEGGVVGTARVRPGVGVRSELLVGRSVVPLLATLLPLLVVALPQARFVAALAAAVLTGLVVSSIDTAVMVAGGLLQTLGLHAPGTALTVSLPVQALQMSAGGANVAIAIALGALVCAMASRKDPEPRHRR